MPSGHPHLPTQRSIQAIALYLFSLPLSLGSSHLGKVLLSAQFTHGFMLGLALMMDAFATVWIIQAAFEANRRSAANPQTHVQ